MPEQYTTELNTVNGVPERLLLVPGKRFSGRDGRVFTCTDPDAVLQTFKNDRRLIPIDRDHSLELSGAGYAVGWITDLVIEGDKIYGVVDWTSSGRWEIESKTYKYISPVFYADGTTWNIVKIESVGLTNKPNLYLKALNKEGGGSMPVSKEICAALNIAEAASEGDVVARIAWLQNAANTAGASSAIPKEVCEALNMPATATATDVVAKITALHTPAATGGDTVSKAEYDKVLNRISVAERKIASSTEGQLRTEANTAVDAAVAEGKISPANKAYYVAQCSTIEGLNSFREFAKNAPKVIPASTGTEGDKAPDTTALNAEEKAVCAKLGVSEETYKLGKKATEEKE